MFLCGVGSKAPCACHKPPTRLNVTVTRCFLPKLINRVFSYPISVVIVRLLVCPPARWRSASGYRHRSCHRFAEFVTECNKLFRRQSCLKYAQCSIGNRGCFASVVSGKFAAEVDKNLGRHCLKFCVHRSALCFRVLVSRTP